MAKFSDLLLSDLQLQALNGDCTLRLLRSLPTLARAGDARFHRGLTAPCPAE